MGSMKTLGALFAISAILSAAPLTKAERKAAINEMKRTSKLFHAALKNVSGSQWKFKAGSAWSVAETAEHITLSEETIPGLIPQALKTPAKPPAADAAQKDATILKMVPVRDQKVQAPEQLKPTNKWPDKKAMLAEFDKRRKKNMDYVNTTQDDLRAHAVPHPILGPLDGYQWLLLTSAHTERHVNQIKEVQANANYPKK